MLTTYLNNLPYSKFVLIEDCLEQQGKSILKYILESHLKNAKCKIYYFIFEGNFERVKKSLPYPNVQYYDCISDSRSWLNNSNKKDFNTMISELDKHGSVIVIDSLAHAICLHGDITIYKMLQRLLLNKDLLRIVTILHQDLLENANQTLQCFHHLATLSLVLEPRFKESSRVSYTYRKTSGKVIKQIEEYKFENGNLRTEPIKRIDPKLLVQESINQVLPENLTTFKISLGDKDKESRDKLILPYLPKDSGAEGDKAEGGQIFYQFDHVDDWDEEDPDDDLDI